MISRFSLRRGKSRSRAIAWLLGVGALGSVLVWVLWVPLRECREATAMLADVQAIRVGSATFADAQHLAASYRKHLRDPSQSCSTNRCELVFEFSNAPLGRLHLAQVTLFVVGIQVEGGRIVRAGALLALLARAGELDSRAEVLEAMQPVYTGESSFAVTRRFYGGGRPHYVSVRMTPEASLQQRRDVYAFNLDCLRRLRGCKDASQLLPSMWPPGAEEGRH